MGVKKNFVLDTNVILHDYRCIYNFEENDIYIPIVVLEELDHFKKGMNKSTLTHGNSHVNWICLPMRSCSRRGSR